jgi:predicted O-linked N-acetylglucosamine transferase (SPINDLY family)
MNRKERRAQAKQGGGNMPSTAPAAQAARLFALAAQHHRSGRPAEAEQACRQALAVNPRHDDALHLLGVIALQAGRNVAATQLIRQAIALNARNPAYHANLGIALRMLDRAAEAIESFRRAIALDPGLAVIHYNLGNALRERGDLAEAVRSYENALARDPAYAEAHYNLGIALQLQRKFGAAIESYCKALALKPDHAAVHSNLGNALQEQGRLDEAAQSYRRALNLDPAQAEAEGNLILMSLYRPGTGLADIVQAARRWNERHADRFRAAWPTRSQTGRTGPRPRIGFVSGDFRQHVVGNTLIPAVEGLARRGHRLTCYYNGTIADGMTGRFQAAAAQWRSIAGQPDESVVQRIQADGIDILFDLSGMTALNRLAVFARKPAPVQVAWFGYPATTGLLAMDYLLADRWQVPEAASMHYQEKIARLPDSYVCYAPPPDAPQVAELPSRRNGWITFGSFNETKKITPQTVAVWSRIVNRTPGARMLLKARSFDDAATRARYEALFAEQGVGRDRLEFVGWTPPAEHMQAMSRADIALDSFPYAGGATTLDTLWMGVPVVACPGEPLSSRHSTSYLSTIGMPELIAGDLDHYVELAVALANDPLRLADLRATLRPHMAASPLCDAERFVNHLEAACMAMWTRHLAGEPPESFDVAHLPLSDDAGK